MDNKKKNKKQKKKILALAMVLALIIVIGGTFAWFTSTDEVTNKLSSSADYNVVIAESFEPETTFLPGEVVNKDVAATNTGNIDAFVSLTLSATLELVTEGTSEDFNSTNTAKYIELSKTSVAAVTGTVGGSSSTAYGSTGYQYGSVNSIQAGGVLAYTTNSDDTSNIGTILSDNFTPNLSTNDGAYYIFVNSVTVNTDNSSVTGYTYTYDGYYVYYDGTSYTYYAIELPTGLDSVTYTISGGLNTINSDGTYDSSTTAFGASGANLKVRTLATSVLSFASSGNSSNCTWALDNTDNKITVTYDPDSSSNSGDEIIIYINLDSNYSSYWAYVGTDVYTWYYNYVLASGTTTPNLVTSVELASSTTEDAYYSFNFYLDVALSSIQVAADDNDTTYGYGATVYADNSWKAKTDKVSSDGNDGYQYVSSNKITWSAKS